MPKIYIDQNTGTISGQTDTSYEKLTSGITINGYLEGRLEYDAHGHVITPENLKDRVKGLNDEHVAQIDSDSYINNGSGMIALVHESLPQKWLASDVAGTAILIDGNIIPEQGLYHAPEAISYRINQQGKEGELFTLSMSNRLFTDPNGDQLTYSMTLADGSPLPSWLVFDTTTNVLSGIPTDQDVGTLNLKVTATNSGGLSASQDIPLQIITERAFFYNEVFGGSNDDLLAGTPGNDYFNGGSGNDTYYFNKGWGQDVISTIDLGFSGYDGTDVIRFGEGVLSHDIKVSLSGYMDEANSGDLILQFMETQDQITIKSYTDLWSDSHCIDEIHFADGTIWTDETIRDLLNVNPFLIEGTAEQSTIFGTYLNDYIYGVDGQNNSLWANGGDDTLIGGMGDDILEGGYGNDIYYFEQGWGKDVIYDFGYYYDFDPERSEMTKFYENNIIQFGEGITKNDIAMSSASGHLVINHNNGVDQIIISGFFISEEYPIHALSFFDGTTISAGEIHALINIRSMPIQTLSAVDEINVIRHPIKPQAAEVNLLVNAIASFGVSETAEHLITDDGRSPQNYLMSTDHNILC